MSCNGLSSPKRAVVRSNQNGRSEAAGDPTKPNSKCCKIKAFRLNQMGESSFTPKMRGFNSLTAHHLQINDLSQNEARATKLSLVALNLFPSCHAPERIRKVRIIRVHHDVPAS